MHSTKPGRCYFVYQVLDKIGTVLYVGCTANPDERWRMHRHDKPELATHAARFRLRGPYTHPVALSIERAAIRRINPLFNLEVPRAERYIKRCAIRRLAEPAAS
jgi:predicted GIY-YIG superfamily endonuclease